MITGWRIVQRRFAAGALTGDAARRFGGRWNSKGTPIVYASESKALAALEILVHLKKADVLREYVASSIAFDESLVTTFDRAVLPPNWRHRRAWPRLQEIGDSWAGGGDKPVLVVPSAVVPTEDNYLINPRHVEFSKLIIGVPEPFRFDRRLAR